MNELFLRLFDDDQSKTKNKNAKSLNISKKYMNC